MWHKIGKQWVVGLSALSFSVLAVAGSDTENPGQGQQSQVAEQQAMTSEVGLYAGVMMGGFYRNMKDSLALAGAVKLDGRSSTKWDWGRGGFNIGADIGYQFTDELSIEMGTIYLQPQKFKFTSGSGAASDSYCNTVYCYAAGSYTKLSTWTTYVGVKVQTEIWRQLSVYTKLAAAYVNTRYRIHLASGSQLIGGGSAADDAAADTSYWAPAIAIGAEYRFANKWRASVQYMLILNGNTLYNDPAVVDGKISTINNVAQPSMQLFTVGVEYQFLT
jgi:hypothetical protein